MTSRAHHTGISGSPVTLAVRPHALGINDGPPQSSTFTDHPHILPNIFIYICRLIFSTSDSCGWRWIASPTMSLTGTLSMRRTRTGWCVNEVKRWRHWRRSRSRSMQKWAKSRRTTNRNKSHSSHHHRHRHPLRLRSIPKSKNWSSVCEISEDGMPLQARNCTAPWVAVMVWISSMRSFRRHPWMVSLMAIPPL